MVPLIRTRASSPSGAPAACPNPRGTAVPAAVPRHLSNGYSGFQRSARSVSGSAATLRQTRRHPAVAWGRSLMPTNHPVPDPRGRVRRALFRGAALAAAGLLTITALVQVASPAAAAPVPSPGGGSATASTVNFGATARSPGATALPPVDRRVAEFRQRARVDLPARPASGHRPGAPAAPRLAPSITSSFDGINQATGCRSCQPP